MAEATGPQVLEPLKKLKSIPVKLVEEYFTSGHRTCQGCESALVMKLMAKAADIARDRSLTDGFRLVLNCNAGAGQTVFHLHLHLLGGRAFRWPPG